MTGSCIVHYKNQSWSKHNNVMYVFCETRLLIFYNHVFRTCSRKLKSTDNLCRKSGNPVDCTSDAKSRVPDSSDIKPRAPVPRITSLCCVKPVVSTTATPNVASKKTSSVQRYMYSTYTNSKVLCSYFSQGL